MRFSGAIAATMLALAVPAGAQTVKDGVDAWQRGDYDAAVRAWRPLAAAGNGDAAFDLAQAYKLGRGVAPDLQQAKGYYGQAARAGHIQGAANYGLLLFQDGDRATALPWIKKASDDGDPRAQYVYGTALFNGDLAPKDWPRAYALMTRAAAAGLPQATTSLAQMNQFIPAADRDKGLALASRMASRPVPPLGKALVTGGGSDTITPRPSPIETASAAPFTPPPAMTPPRAAPPSMPPPSPPRSTKPVPAPRPQPAPAPAPVLAKSGGAWMVQLGAFGSQAAAQTAWNALTAKSAALRGLSPRYEKAGAVVRLRAAGLADHAGAEQACAAAKSAGAACFPVAP